MDKYRIALESYRIIRPEHESIHETLLNWARWCKVNTHPHRRTPSLEGRYRPPPMWEEPILSKPPDLKLAYSIERLIVVSPHDYGKHIRFWYIRRLSLSMAAKKLHITPLKLESHLAASREFIKNHLTFA